MRLTRSMLPRPAALFLVLLPSVLFCSLKWLVESQFDWAEEALFLLLAGPLCLLATWCALGRTNVWLRFAIVATTCSAWSLWIYQFGAAESELDPPYFVAIFGTFVWPLCLLRLSGVSIQLTQQSAPTVDVTQSSQIRDWLPRFSLWSLFQLVTLGALVMATDRLFEFSQQVERDEILIGATISIVTASVAWVCLGTRLLWLRLLTWLSIPAIIYLPLDGDLNFVLTLWLGLTTVLSAELLGFRRLGYRLVWGTAPVASIAAHAINWRPLARGLAAVVTIALYLLFLGKCLAWSQPLIAPWRIDGMATLGAYITVNLQTPILLLAIWCSLGSPGLAIRLVTTTVGGILLTTYYVMAEPFGALRVEPQLIAQQLIATAIPLFVLRPFGFAICKPREVRDVATPQTWRPQTTLKNAFIITTAAALLMGVYHWTSLFQVRSESTVLRGFLFANLLIITLVYACLGGTRWWWRMIPLLVCCQLSIGLLDEFPARNTAWVGSNVVGVGGVLLAFRLRGFRFERPLSPPATAPALDPITSLAEATNSLSLAVSK